MNEDAATVTSHICILSSQLMICFEGNKKCRLVAGAVALLKKVCHDEWVLRKSMPGPVFLSAGRWGGSGQLPLQHHVACVLPNSSENVSKSTIIYYL